MSTGSKLALPESEESGSSAIVGSGRKPRRRYR